MDVSTIGFLKTYSFEDGAATRGAMLVTDIEIKPLEFRVTAPVRPTAFQETLYGDLLEEYIAIELMGLPLLDAFQIKPDLVVVRDALLLLLNSKQNIPTVWLVKEDEALLKKNISTHSLSSPDSSRPSAKICMSSNFESQLEEITQNLQPIFSARDLIEPFNRVEKACVDVHTRGVGEK